MYNYHRQLLALSGALLCSLALQAQTVLINPSTEGGFELPGGFAGNGWTLDNGTVTNQWFTGVLPGFNATNVAYISEDGGLSNTYDISSTSVVHFYRDITLPAGETEILLSFDWWGQAEGNWDQLLVSVAPTSYTPTASNMTLGSGVLAAPVLNIARYSGSNTVQSESIIIPASVAGNCTAPATWRLIFTWKNDNSFGTQPPVAIDNISLTTAAPSGPAASLGTFTIDNTLPTAGVNFASFTEAINWLNAQTNCGPLPNAIVFNVAAGQSFAERPPAIVTSGDATNTITFQKAGTGANPIIVATAGNSFADAVIDINGGDYITFDGIDIGETPGHSTSEELIEYGYRIRNVSATDGAQFNTIKNCQVAINNQRTIGRAILQTSSVTGGGFTASAPSGANSNNSYQNITIASGYTGIQLLAASGTNLDSDNVIEDCTVGLPGAVTVGNETLTGLSYGIRGDNQNDLIIRRNTVQNMAVQNTVDGIFVTGGRGLVDISRNSVQSIRNSTTGISAASATGIRVTMATGTHELRIYNNVVSDIYSTRSGTSSVTRVARGIYVYGGNASCTYNIDFNSVSINNTSALTSSSSAFETGSSTPLLFVRNNVFANYTANQTGTAFHVAAYFSNATTLGAAGSISNYNAFFAPNADNGHVARGGTTFYTSLNDLQAAYSSDANSFVSNPLFLDAATDLRPNAAALIGAGDITGITWVNEDIEGTTRTAPHTVGAYLFTPIPLDISLSSVTSPVENTQGCYGIEDVELVLTNSGALAIDFSTNNATVTATITGAATQTLTLVLNDNSLNAGAPLASGESLTVNLGTLDMSNAGTYNFAFNVNMVGDGIATNNDAALSLGVTSPTALPITVDFTGFTGANLDAAFPGWFEASGDIPSPSGSASTWISQTGLNATGNTTARINLFTNTRREWIIGPRFEAEANTQVSFDAAVTNWNSITAGNLMGSDDSLVVLVSTDCGVTYSPLLLINVTDNLGTDFRTYVVDLGVYAGQQINIAFFASDGAVNDPEDYDLHIDNINICNRPEAAMASSLSACEGEDVDVQATATTGTDVSWFDVATQGTALATGSTYSITAIAASTTVYAQADSLGCTNYNRTVVDITANPTPAAAPSASAPTICAGETTVLEASALPAGERAVWYDVATGGTALDTSIYNTPALSVNTIYYASAISAFGCETTTRTLVEIVVNAAPAAPTTTSASICEGDDATLTATGTNLSWFDAATMGTVVNTGTDYSLSAPVAGAYSFFVEDQASGCASARSLVELTVTALPAAPTVANASLSVCFGSDATLEAAGGDITWYEVATAGSNIGQGSPLVLTMNTTTGTFEYYAESAVNGCASASRSLVEVEVNAIDTATISYPSTSYCADQVASSDAAAITGTTGGAFSLIAGPDALAIDALTGVIDFAGFATTGTYTVQYETAGPCPATESFDLQLDICSSLDALAGQSGKSFSLFPNPNAGLFTLAYAGENQSVSLRILDVLGREVYTAESLELSNDAKIQIQLNGLVSGNYFVQIIEADKSVQTLKMILR